MTRYNRTIKYFWQRKGPLYYIEVEKGYSASGHMRVRLKTKTAIMGVISPIKSMSYMLFDRGDTKTGLSKLYADLKDLENKNIAVLPDDRFEDEIGQIWKVIRRDIYANYRDVDVYLVEQISDDLVET